MWNFTPEEVDQLWQWAPILVILFVALVRFLYYAHRRRDPEYQNWEPVEVMMIRSIALLCTGKPLNKRTWKRVDLVLLILLAMGIGLYVFDVQTGGRYRSPVRQFFTNRFGIKGSSGNRK